MCTKFVLPLPHFRVRFAPTNADRESTVPGVDWVVNATITGPVITSPGHVDVNLDSEAKGTDATFHICFSTRTKIILYVEVNSSTTLRFVEIWLTLSVRITLPFPSKFNQHDEDAVDVKWITFRMKWAANVNVNIRCEPTLKLKGWVLGVSFQKTGVCPVVNFFPFYGKLKVWNSGDVSSVALQRSFPFGWCGPFRHSGWQFI